MRLHCHQVDLRTQCDEMLQGRVIKQVNKFIHPASSFKPGKYAWLVWHLTISVNSARLSGPWSLRALSDQMHFIWIGQLWSQTGFSLMHAKISPGGLVAIVKTLLINVDNRWVLMPHYSLVVSLGYFSSDPLFVSVCVVAVECCCLIFI